MSAATFRSSSLRMALIQLAVGANKQANLERAGKFVKEAAANNAKLVCLPECFNSPYGVDFFPTYAETTPDGESSRSLQQMAKDNSVFLIGGSIPERDTASGKLYNTCQVFGPEGQLLAKHRKVHLFDIDVPGGIKFTESLALSAGDQLTTFQCGDWKIGLGICYDIRFPEMAHRYDKLGCDMLVYPGAFNTTTGPAHWELLTRSRALDHQFFVACCSPARDLAAQYHAWGHSTICGPWGDVMAKADETEQVVYADLGLEAVDKTRLAIPVHHQRRDDVYMKTDE